jgi:hypothetical protein
VRDDVVRGLDRARVEEEVHVAALGNAHGDGAEHGAAGGDERALVRGEQLHDEAR